MTYQNLISIPLGLAGTLYRSPMPFGALDIEHATLAEYLDAGVDTVVMLIEEGEDLLRSRRDLAQTYASHQIKTIIYPIMDFDTPDDPGSLLEILHKVLNRIKHGENVAVHCFAGRGRTGLFIALLARMALGLDGQAAINWVRGYFPAIETDEQEKLVRELNLEER